MKSMKPIAFTTEVLRGKLSALEQFGYFETRRPVVAGTVRPPYPPGSTLWVREGARVVTFTGLSEEGTRSARVRYDVDGTELEVPWPDRLRAPVIGRGLANGCHTEAARTFLVVQGARREQLNDISNHSAILEGIDAASTEPRREFSRLWESLYGQGSFDARLVWVYRMRATERPT